MKKTTKKSLVALRAAVTMLVICVMMSLSTMTAFATTPTGDRASITDNVADTGTRAPQGLNWLTWTLIIVVILILVGIVVYAITRSIKKSREATAQAISAGQQAVVQMIDPNLRLNGSNAIVREVPVGRTTNADGSVTFSGPTTAPVPNGAPATPATPANNPWRN